MNAPLRAGARALVLGLGRFGGGLAAVRFLRQRGLAVRIADKSAGSDLQQSRAALADLDLDWQLGREDRELLAGVDLIVVNPAVPDEHPLLAAASAAGVEATQEANLFLDAYPGSVIAVTGTNGKSTTASLLHAALQRAGLPALLGGNIGHSLLADEGQWHSGQIAVLEISSFQLERLDLARHRVRGAVFTRVLKDHLDRHKTLAAYHAAKGRLAAIAQQFVVHAGDDPVAAAFRTPAAQRLVFAFTAPAAASIGERDGFVTARLDAGEPVPIVHAKALRLLGDFQRENVMAASAAALSCGASAHAVGLAMANAAPLPFRLQLVAVLAGVSVFDNGVSTEIESTRSALRALSGRIRWVGGGKSKDGDFQTVADGVAPHLTSAHLFGSAAEPLSACLAGRVPHSRHLRVQEALDAALAAARPGDQLLFSPAFASFDQYPNFRARALEFHQWLDLRRRATAAGGEAAQ
ncbi:MAG TPA: UDP-N-acetylmuramoyl-L-alanine--D-glutamate ligase [Planctomycetota bacterium]|nr:UDP-N-acetylmuramoyl-L-alanine--D-glutamate ligase [Planctomycetota bacterium]